jgi:hypothetical protein
MWFFLNGGEIPGALVFRVVSAVTKSERLDIQGWEIGNHLLNR